MKAKEVTNLINEAKAGRAWNNKLKGLDSLLAWMYDKNLLTKDEKKKKDIVFRQYYRYYNDGDFPRALARKGMRNPTTFYKGNSYTTDKDQAERVEIALEEYLEDFIKQILVKYSGKIDRAAFRFDKFMREMNQLKDILKSNNFHGVTKYWGNKYKVDDTKFQELLVQLTADYNKFDAEVNKVNPDGSNTGLSYRRDQMKEQGIWNDEFEYGFEQLENICIKMSRIIEDLILATKRAKKVVRK